MTAPGNRRKRSNAQASTGSRSSSIYPSYRFFVGVQNTAASMQAAWMQAGAAPELLPPLAVTATGLSLLHQRLAAAGIAPAQTLVLPQIGGPHWAALARSLQQAGYAVSPLRAERAVALAHPHFRTNRPVDALLLAELAALIQPLPWSPRRLLLAELYQLLLRHSRPLRRPRRLLKQAARPLAAASLATALTWPAAQPATAATAPLGASFIVNETTTADQRDSAVAVDNEGDFVVVWEEQNGSSFAIYAKLYNRDGSVARGEQAIATGNLRIENPDVAIDADGDFVVVWEAPGSGSGGLIRAQRYDAAGQAQGAIIEVAEVDEPSEFVAVPAVAINADGGFVIVWQERVNESPDTVDRLKARVYDNQGGLQSDVSIDETTLINTIRLERPDVAIDDNSAFVVVWQKSDGTGDFTTTIEGRQFTAAGAPDGDAIEFERVVSETLNAGTPEEVYVSGSVNNPSVAMDDDGGFVVTWNGSIGQYFADPEQDYLSESFVGYRLVAADGSTVAEDRLSNDNKSVDQPDVVMDNDGDFVLAYQVWNADDNSQSIEYRHYGAAGQPDAEGTRSAINLPAGTRLSDLAIGSDADGDFVLAWTENSSTRPTVNQDVVAQQFAVVPQITTSSTTLNYSENDPPTIIDSALAIESVDSSLILSATVTISDSYMMAEDSLAISGMLPVRISATAFDAASGSLTLSGAAPAGDYQAALRQVVYSNSSDDPDTSARTVEFVIKQAGKSDRATREIAVSPVNDPPVLAGSSATLNYDIGRDPVIVDPNIALSDPDNSPILSATMTISGSFAANAETLVISGALPAGIESNFDPETGELTLSGSASVADYQAALRQVAYSNNGASGALGLRTIVFRVNDGTNSAGFERQINVTELIVDPLSGRVYLPFVAGPPDS